MPKVKRITHHAVMQLRTRFPDPLWTLGNDQLREKLKEAAAGAAPLPNQPHLFVGTLLGRRVKLTINQQQTLITVACPDSPSEHIG